MKVVVHGWFRYWSKFALEGGVVKKKKKKEKKKTNVYDYKEKKKVKRERERQRNVIFFINVLFV